MTDLVRSARSTAWTRRQLLTRVGTGALGLASASLLAACGDDDSSGNGDSSEPYVLGQIITQTGPLAGSIAPNFAGLSIAVAEVNAAGGINGRQVRLSALDDQYQPAQQPVLLQRFASEGINNIAGPIGSSNVEAILPLSTPRKIITQGWAKTDSQGDATQWPYNFPLIYTSSTEGRMLAQQALAVGARKFGILAEQTLFGETLTAAAHEVFDRAGPGAVVESVVEFPLDATDMRPYIERLRSDGVDAIGMFTVSGTAVGQSVVAMGNLNFFPPIMTLVGPWNATTLEQLPPQLEDRAFANNFAVLSYDDQNPIADRVREYAEKIAADEQGQRALAGAVTASFYDWVYMLKAAIEETGSDDSDSIKEYLESTPYDGVLGTYRLSATSHNAFGEQDLAMLEVASLREEASMGGIFGRRAAT